MHMQLVYSSTPYNYLPLLHSGTNCAFPKYELKCRLRLAVFSFFLNLISKFFLGKSELQCVLIKFVLTVKKCQTEGPQKHVVEDMKLRNLHIKL